MSEIGSSYRNPSPPPNVNEEISELSSLNNYENTKNENIKIELDRNEVNTENDLNENIVINNNSYILNDNVISSNINDETEKKEDLYDLYQQIILLMKDIIEMIDLDKVDEIDNDVNNDNELQKKLCILWDITCQEENAKLVVNCISSSISIFLKLISITKLERTQELCLGILGNIACFESLYNSLYENEILINILGLTFSSSMDPEVLFSCCRLIKNIIIGFCKLTYIQENETNSSDNNINQKDNKLNDFEDKSHLKVLFYQAFHFHKNFINSFQNYDIYKKFIFILENSLNSNLLKEVLDIIYLIYSTVFLKEYFIFDTLDGWYNEIDKDSNSNENKNENENEKLKLAEYHLEIFKSIPEYLMNFILKNFQYINYVERKKIEHKDTFIVEKTKEEKEKENKIFLQNKLFFDIFESKFETMVSLLRIAYILLRNNNFLMIDEQIQQNLIKIILEWIYLQSRYLKNSSIEYKYQDYEEKENDNDNDDMGDSNLIDGINLSFKLLELYININSCNSAIFYDLFFSPEYRNMYKMEIIIQYLISHCMPKETGWKILNWIAKEIKNYTHELESNLYNVKNSNTKLIIQSFLLSNQEAILSNEAINLEPKIKNQEKIREHLNLSLLTIIEFSEYYLRGIEQDDEEIYGDIKQKIIQNRLHKLQGLLIKKNPIKNEKIKKWVKDIVYDEEAEMDYHEKARKLEVLLVDTCSSVLSLRNTFELINKEEEKRNYYELCQPIFNLLSKLFEF